MVSNLASWPLCSLLKTVPYNANPVTSSLINTRISLLPDQNQYRPSLWRVQPTISTTKQHGWDITANGKHADPIFRELLLFPSPAFTSLLAPDIAKFSNLSLHMRHTYNIHELFSIATKVFINLPVIPILHPFNTISPHLFIPIQTSNLQPQQTGQSNLDQKAATLYGAIQNKTNPSPTLLTTVKQFNSEKFINGIRHTETTSATSKINLHHNHNKKIKLKITPIEISVIGTSPRPTSIQLKLGKSSNPYSLKILLLPTNEW